MAEFYTSQWGSNTSPRIRLVVTVSNVNGNTARVSWVLDYVTSGYAASTNGVARSWTIAIDGQVRSGSFNINGVSSTTRISSGTIDIKRQNTSRSISCSASFNFDITWSGSYSGSRTATGNVNIDARTSNTVSYNANGGSGAPGPQTKWYGDILTLSSTIPTRNGYGFKGWATSSTGSVAYQPGGQYGEDVTRTLYAVWQAGTYTVAYNANGGSGAPSTQTKTHGVNLTLSSTKPTRANYTFLGWGTSSGSTTVAYAPGSTYSLNDSITLYAIWSLSYRPPRLTNLKIDRCNSAGTVTDEGTYFKVTGSWYTDYNATTLYIRYKIASKATDWAESSYTLSGRSGSINSIVGSGGISTENVYSVQIEIRDGNGSSTFSGEVSAMKYIIDFKTGGNGVAIGKPSTVDNLFDVNLNTKINNSLSVSKAASFYGGVYCESQLFIKKGWYTVSISQTSNLNDFTTTGFYKCVTNSDASTMYNLPVKEAFSLEVYENNGVTQIFTTYGTRPKRYIRSYYSGSWGSWYRMIDEDYYNEMQKPVYKGTITFPYGLSGRAYKSGCMVTINFARQTVSFGGSGENKASSETLPTWAKPVSETAFNLNRSSGTGTVTWPLTLHLRSDGSIAYSSYGAGTNMFSGSVTYMSSNLD